MKRVVTALMLVASPALACPACASGQTGSRWLYLVLVLVPFAIVGLASRAIYLALRE